MSTLHYISHSCDYRSLKTTLHTDTHTVDSMSCISLQHCFCCFKPYTAVCHCVHVCEIKSERAPVYSICFCSHAPRQTSTFSKSKQRVFGKKEGAWDHEPRWLNACTILQQHMLFVCWFILFTVYSARYCSLQLFYPFTIKMFQSGCKARGP